MSFSHAADTRIEWIDILKGIGIVLIVFCHICSNPVITGYFYCFHVALFFFVSGMVHHPSENQLYIKQKFRSIIIPYFSFGCLEIVYFHIFEQHFRNTQITITESMKGLLSGQFENLFFNVHLWFLPCLFLCCIFFNTIITIENKKMIFFLIFFITIISSFFSVPSLLWGIDRVLKYLPIYAIGYASFQNDLFQKNNKKLKYLFFIGLILLLFVYVLFVFQYTSGILWYVVALSGISGCTCFAIRLTNHSRFLKSLGKKTLIILCTHGPVYRVIIQLWSILFHIPTDTIRANIFLSIIICIITIGICSAIDIIIKKYLPWMIGK